MSNTIQKKWQIYANILFCSHFTHREKTEVLNLGLFGTPAGNRTRNCPLGGGCYIHLTTEAHLLKLKYNTTNSHKNQLICHTMGIKFLNYPPVRRGREYVT